MDLPLQTSLFSRQGKATSHMHPEFSTGPKPRPKGKEIEPVKISDLSSMLTDLEQKRLQQESDAKSKPKPLTSSFRAVSRDEYAFAFRNRTESPRVGNYSPRFTVVEPRATHTLKLCKNSSVPKERLIYLPACLNNFSCSLATRTKDHLASKSIKREPKPLKHFEDTVKDLEKKNPQDPVKPKERLKLPIAFDKQKTRPEFVKDSDPPNEKRFQYVENDSFVYSKHRRVSSLPFDKNIPRKDFFETRESLSPYDVNKEFTMKKLSLTVMEFSKMSPRKPLVLDHMLKTPAQLEDEKIDAAYMKQSVVRGRHKIPLMSTVTPRDDLMYRTTERYILNVPEKQAASTVPRFMGMASPSLSSARKFRSVIE